MCRSLFSDGPGAYTCDAKRLPSWATGWRAAWSDMCSTRRHRATWRLAPLIYGKTDDMPCGTFLGAQIRKMTASTRKRNHVAYVLGLFETGLMAIRSLG